MDNMQTTKISQLPIAENITKDTILPVVQDDETQAATAGQIAALAEMVPSPEGPQGPQGEAGPKGDPGDPATVDIQQSTGESTTAVMSQNAVTEALNGKQDTIKAGEITNTMLADGAVTSDKLADDTIKNVASQSILGSGDAIPTFTNDDITIDGNVAILSGHNFEYNAGCIFRIISNKLDGVSAIKVNSSGSLKLRVTRFDGSSTLGTITLKSGFYHLTLTGMNANDCLIAAGAAPQIMGDEIAQGAVGSDNVDWETFPSVVSWKDTDNKATVTLTVKLPRRISSGYYFRTDVIGASGKVVEHLLFVELSLNTENKAYITPVTSTMEKLNSVVASNYNQEALTVDLTFEYSSTIYWYLRVEAMNKF